jgi:hypothetical protein
LTSKAPEVALKENLHRAVSFENLAHVSFKALLKVVKTETNPCPAIFDSCSFR